MLESADVPVISGTNVHPASATLPNTATLSGHGPARTVLVVGDCRFVRAALAGRFVLRLAESSERAWRLLVEDASIAAVLSDLSMPGIDGFGLLQRVREATDERVRRLPFAVLSGADDSEHRERVRDGGADRFVIKGGGVDELAGWVDSIWGSEDRVIAEHTRASTSTSADARARVHDPFVAWLRVAVAHAADPSSVVLMRVRAPEAPALPARLRRGVRSEHALFIADPGTAWLCVGAGSPLATRLALRLGLLASGPVRRGTAAPTQGAGVRIWLRTLSLQDPEAARLAIEASADADPGPADGLHLIAGPGEADAGWECRLPWALVRLLVR